MLNKISVITLLVIAFVFFMINIFYSTNGFTSHIDSSNYVYTIIPAVCIMFALFATGFSSSTLQYGTRNPLASPMTVGIFPALTFSYLISTIYGFPSNAWLRLLINIILSIFVLLIYLIIDLKVNNESKIIFSFTLAITLSAISMILYSKYGLQKSGTLLFSIDKLDMSSLKMWIGIVLVFIGFSVLFVIKKQLHIYSTSPHRASSLGVNVFRMKILSLFSVAIMLNGAFIMFGILSFIGLIIPNIVKLIGFNKYFTSSLVSGLLSIVIGLAAYLFSKVFLIDLFLMYSLISIPFIIIVFVRIKKVVCIE